MEDTVDSKVRDDLVILNCSEHCLTSIDMTWEPG